MADQTFLRKLRPSESWFHDGLLVCQRPVINVSLEVDLTEWRDFLKESRGFGLHLTYAHLFVRAAAVVLHDNPRLHTLMCGSHIHINRTVDIALSVSSSDAVTPVLIVRAADQKPLPAIAEEVIRRMPEAVREQERLLALLDRWGWVIPVGFVRRAILRTLGRNVGFRRAGSGTFQVSVIRGVDRVSTSVFNTSAILMVGEVKERVVPHKGSPALRRTAAFTCCADHRVWNGGDCRFFLESLQAVLTNGRLADECRKAVTLSV